MGGPDLRALNGKAGGRRIFTMKPTLNLGCGPDSWGDVRVDVQSWNGNANLILDFDVMRLPFPDKYFSECLINHVLEHSKNPQRLLQEAIRVSDLVHAKYPYKYDRMPFILKGLVTLNFRLVYLQSRAQVEDRLARASIIKNPSPDTHRWTVGPFGRRQVNEFDVFRLNEWVKNRSSPRTATGKILKGILMRSMKFLPNIRIGCEWECWYP